MTIPMDSFLMLASSVSLPHYYEHVNDDDALCPSTETPLLLRVCIVIVSCDVPPSHILLMSYTLTTFLNETKNIYNNI